MIYYIGFISFLISAIICHRKHFCKQKDILCIYLLSIVYACLHFFYMYRHILFQIEFTYADNIINIIAKIFPIIIIFLMAISLRRVKK